MLKVLEFLIKKGAKINMEDRWGGTAMRDAVREGYVDCAAKLRDAGGKLMYDEVRYDRQIASQSCLAMLCSLPCSYENVRTLPNS